MNRFSSPRFSLLTAFALFLLVSCGGDSPPTQEPPHPPMERPPSTPIDDPPTVPEPPFTPIQVPLYALVSLGVLDGYSDCEAYGLNDWGQVVGSCWRNFAFDNRSEPWEEAFLWEDGQIRPLGVLPPWGEYSRAVAINNLGQMVGEGDNPSFHTFFWEADGTLRDLYLNQSNESTAYDINDLGQVTGFNFKSQFPQAYIWEDDRVLELGAEFGESSGHAINNAGQVVGTMTPATGTTENGWTIWSSPNAFLWESGRIRDLGLFGRASDINEGGQIVGYKSIPDGNSTSAFLWQDGTFTVLGHLGGEHSQAEAINDAGQMVGRSWEEVYNPANPESTRYSATLWERGRVRNLNQLADTGGAHLQRAFDINDRGQIVGRAKTGETCHGFLLTPHWEGFITPESSFSTAMELGEKLIFDYWADIMPGSGATSPFTIDVMVMDAAGNWSFFGQMKEQAVSATWKTAFVQGPENLIGTTQDLSLQLSGYDTAADPIIFVKGFRAHEGRP